MLFCKGAKMLHHVRKLMLAVALVAACGCLGAVIAGEKQNADIVVGVSIDNIDSQFWFANIAAMRDEAKRLGVKYVEVVAESDSTKQQQQIENLISQKVDAIVCIPKDKVAIVAAAKKANEAGIPFLTNNRAAEPGAVIAFNVESDNYAMAKQEAEWLADYARKNGMILNTLVFVGDLKDINAGQRDKGFTEGAEANKDVIKIVSKVPTEWKPELALAGAVNALEANPEINCIFIPSDALLPPVRSAMEQHDRWELKGHKNHIVFATFDGAAEAMELIREGYVDVCLAQDATLAGKSCIETAVKLAKGEKIPTDNLKDPGILVYAENYDSVKHRLWGHEE